MSENNLSKFERATVVFAPGLEVDGYQTPNGEYRVGMASSSKVVGFASNWLSRLTTREGKALKALQRLGYTGYHLQGRVLHERGATLVETISLDDFLLLVSYAASTGKKQAFALQQAFMKSTAVDFFRYHFGCRDLTMQERLKPFEEKYSHTIAWLEEENANRRADWQLIEEQENFTGLDQYRPQPDND